jgi:arylsulfatase A-like enzyme
VQGQCRKALLVIIDGLRPDAITLQRMPALAGMIQAGWRAEAAATVRPSVTVAALTSLATGITPARHGLTDVRIASLGRLRGLRPLPLELRRHGVGTVVITGQLAGSARWLAGALLRLAGAGRLVPATPSPRNLMDVALRELHGNKARELIVVYLNDADLAGHAWGWMSPAYLQATATIDRALGRLAPLAEDPDALIVVTADHGGGGVLEYEHDHPHPLNEAIPVAMLGGRVIPGTVSREPVHLLDIPPTLLHGFGGTAPAAWEGRVLHEAFIPEPAWA